MAVALMVIEVFIRSSGMSWNSRRMSPTWDTGTPTRPTSPRGRPPTRDPRRGLRPVRAHEAAWRTVEADPELERHPELAEALLRLDAARAAFLERG